MFLTSPLMLLGLLTLPVLAAVYWLRNRAQRTVVSSLMLWVDQRRPHQGGRIWQRIQTPLTFFLELLALLFLVLGAAGPAWLRRDTMRPLIVVLDDSYSMRACAADDVQDAACARAQAAVVEELARGNYVVRWILAGAQPRLLGEPTREPEQARAVLQQWQCQSATADLAAAIALAVEVGGPAARVLVLSDHEPAMTFAGGQVQWWAFGAERPNLAFTAATRTRCGDVERVLLEVANLSAASGASTLRLEGGNLAAPQESNLALAGGTTRQLFLNLPRGAPELRATLQPDALEIDNRVVLVPEATKPVRVLVDVADERLRNAIRRALEATELAVEVSEQPELVISDQAGELRDDAWRVEIFGGDDAAAYVGPFVIDHSHPLAQGLSLHSVVWSASSKTPLPGQPLITAGNVALVTDSADNAGRHHVRLSFVEKQSNVQDMPDWPILFANLLRWRHSALPGVAVRNVRLGQTVTVTLPRETKHVAVRAPKGIAHEVTLRGRRATVSADQVGLHTVTADGAEYSFSCNAVSRDESDLRDCRSGRWGNWSGSPGYQDRHTSFAWLFLIVALAALTSHLVVVARNARGGNL